MNVSAWSISRVGWVEMGTDKLICLYGRRQLHHPAI